MCRCSRRNGRAGLRRDSTGTQTGTPMEDYEEPVTTHRCTRIVYYAWKIFTCLFTHVMLVTLVVAYCILGAVTFESLEKENEKIVKNNITYMRNNVTEDLWSFTKEMSVLHQENWTNNAISRIKLFENDLIKAMRKSGWDGSEEVDNLQWTFAGALFYSIIVITTIGYGHIAPKTPLGKVTTIFYAIVGIPLMLLCLSNIGDIMAHSFRFLYWKICCYACTREPKRAHSARRRTKSLKGSSNGGRHSSRSRTASFRVSGRNSQRSADSALGLSEGLSQVQSFSDTESRYGQGNKEEETVTGRGVYRQNSTYQNDCDSLHRKYGQSSSKPEGNIEDPQSDTPVLFNKYAIDPEEYYKGRVRSTAPVQHPQLLREDSVLSVSSNNGKWSKRNTLNVESSSMTVSPRQRSSEFSGRRAHDSSPMSPSPRIMSPMGFIVPRQTPSKSNDYYSSSFSDYDDDVPSNQTKPVPIWLCVFLVVSYIIGGAFLFSDWEGWAYADSAYFCFITLTTIGFGDFVPAQRVNKKNGEMSIALCSLYLLFGIALLAMSFNLVQEEVINNVKTVARHLGIIKDNTIENGNEYND